MNGISVDVHAVTHRYGRATVLDDVDLRIASGTRHAIIGPNGAGKTTLLGLIAGIGRPTTGRIHFDGRDVTNLPQDHRARLGMSRTWQHPAVIDSLTAVDNLALALRGMRLRTARTAAADLLQEVRIPGQHRAGQLPYGQRRILELLIALAPRPRLVVLDEPSAGLDDGEVTELLQRLVETAADTTVVFTDHSRRLVSAVADTVTILDRGRQLVTGAPAAVMTASTPRQSAAPSAGGQPLAASRRRIEGPGAEPALRLTDLHAGYRSHLVLRGVDLSVAAGAVVAIIGVDGAGRTTLIDAIAGTLRTLSPSRVQLAGADLTGLTAAGRTRMGLGTVPQHRMPMRALTIAEQLRLAGVDPREFPGQLATMAPWLHHRAQQRVETLSGGERQILAVACATARKPSVLLLDEVTEGMALPVIEALRHLIRALAATGTAVLLTDTPQGALVDIADRTLRLRHGRIEPA